MLSLRLNKTKSVTRQRIEDSRLQQYACENWKQDYFNDVTVGVGNQCIPANRMLLSCYSRYFEEEFKPKKEYQYSISINDADDQAVKSLITYMYTGKITINNENVLIILSAAHKLKMKEVKEYCFDFLESFINCDTCFDILNASNLYESNSLKEKVYKFIGENFGEIYQQLNFKNLTLSDLKSCICNLNRNKIEETLIYEAMITWTNHDVTARQMEFVDLFQLLKLDELSSEYLSNVISKETLVRNNFDCAALVMDKLSELLNEKKEKEIASRIISLGGNALRTKVVEVHNVLGEPSKNFPDLTIGVQNHCSVNLDNIVYCVGGWTRDGLTDAAWKMNLNEEPLKWEEIASMNEKKSFMGTAIYKNTLVVAGGFNLKGGTNSVIIYLKQQNKWQTISPLQQGRSGNALVACDDCLYAVGGYNGKEYLSSVERLCGLDGAWQYVASMQTARNLAAAVNCRGVVYVIGGWNGTSSLKSVEKYDADANKWIYVSDMKFERMRHSACVLQDKIFVVGGKNAKGEIIKEIERYDPSRDTWSIVGNTVDDLWRHSLVVV